MSNKYRKFCITINKSSNCFCSADTILKSLDRVNYAYIIHNKDQNCEEHIHIVLDFANAHSWNRIQELFQGAHIEDMKGSVSQALRYLIHQGQDTKYQYDKSCIITNNNNWLNQGFKDNTRTFTIATEENIIADKLLSYEELLLKYGIDQFPKVVKIVDFLRKDNQELQEYLTTQDRVIKCLQNELLTFKSEFRKLQDELKLAQSINDSKLPF